MSLSYEFYYLLRTQVEQNPQSEPESFLTEQPSLRQEGIPIDEDKRLFRSETYVVPSSQTGLPEQWAVELKQSWEQIQRSYQEHFAKEAVSETQAKEFCSQALLGVALLIADTQLDYAITMPLHGSNAADQIVFKPGPDLLGVIHQLPEHSDAARMPAPARFVRFDPARRRNSQLKLQLRFEAATPYLAPMDMTTDTPNPHFAANPVFAIYGLAHGDLPKAEDWPRQLQDFLLSGDAAVLVRVLPRLLVRQWQFSRMDLAARLVRQYLRKQGNHFNQAPLQCLSNRELSMGLQTLAELDADATLLLGKLPQAIKTIEIHKGNLTQRLKQAEQHSDQWSLIWQRNQESPLLDSFTADQQKLQNHITYLQGELTFLEGIRRRWHFHFEGRQLAWTERLGSLGSILAFMVGVGVASITASTSSQSDTSTSDSWLSPLVQWLNQLLTLPWITDLIRLLNNPLTYILLVFVFVSPLIWYSGKALFRIIRCCCKRWKIFVGWVERSETHQT